MSKGILNFPGEISLKFRAKISPKFTDVACTLISTSLSFGAGLSTSFNLRTSGDPYFVHIIALISIPPNLL